MDAEKKMSMQEASEKGLLSEDVAEEKRAQLKQLFRKCSPKTRSISSSFAG